MAFINELFSPETLQAAQSFIDYLGSVAPNIVVEDIITRSQELANSNIVVEDIITRGSNIVVEDIITRGQDVASSNIVVEDIITRA